MSRLTKVQREMLGEFAAGAHPDRYVTGRYRRTAHVLTEHGYLRAQVNGWYCLTPAGRKFAEAHA